MSIRRPAREVNGILLLDKPRGITSNQALTEAKRIFSPKKAGHSGSLDPLACGMLAICFGEGTKFSQFLLEADKQYQVTGKLGVRTTTGDAEGEIIATKEVQVDQLALIETLHSFRGNITQVPSMYSALKFQGKPLYVYARQGIEIERQSRTIFIRELNLVNFSHDEFTLTVRCSKGTYIRTLIEDIGDKLGCGAYVTSLRRTFVEPYEHATMVTIEQLKVIQNEGSLDELLLPVESALSSWPEVRLAPSAAFYIQQGQAVIVPRAPSEGWVKLFDEKGGFLGVGEILKDGRVAPKRLIRQSGTGTY